MAEEKKVQNEQAAKPAKPAKEKIPLTQRIKKFFKDYKSEWKKIVWSPKEDVRKNTALVVAIIVVSGVVLVILDLAFNLGITQLGRLV